LGDPGINLEKDLESLTSSVIDHHKIEKVDRKKIIRDAVLGSHELSPLEVSIIDTPFVQRLRGISQTALASLTYPSATHTRFEHSLGVSILAYRMGKALLDNGVKVDKTTLKELRLAGLLHDIGHGPFSHASEEIIRDLDAVKVAFSNDNRFSKSKTHEMITYKMLQTSSFKDFFVELLKLYGETEINLDTISEMIIGSIRDEKKQQYKADIINGAFDADKLDYLGRDAHFTGLKMAIDLERIFATLGIDNRKNKPKRIVVDVGGVHILEQILFNKMLLFPSVYHHHKVRSTVCMLESIFEIIKDNDVAIGELKFNAVSDFLSVDDHFLLCTLQKNERVVSQIEKIKQRHLLKRAMVISSKTVEKNLQELLSKGDRPQYLREIAKIIAQDSRLNGKCEYYDIWVDVPETPRFPEPSRCSVRVTSRDYLDLDNFFPVTEWSDSYAINKWKGFVFGPSSLQKTVAAVAMDVFKELLGIRFNKQAIMQAKHSSSAA
jgi:HD superfamily phosphohydrolase